jgi:hypothetical protein
MRGDKSMSFEQMGKDLGSLVDLKQAAYGDSVSSSYEVMQAFMKRYKTEEGMYLIPEELLKHIMLMVRIIDKQNRIFTNPVQDLMDESPYYDLAGYGLLGNNMSIHTKKKY